MSNYKIKYKKKKEIKVRQKHTAVLLRASRGQSREGQAQTNEGKKRKKFRDRNPNVLQH